jgi:hypothetical protein
MGYEMTTEHKVANLESWIDKTFARRNQLRERVGNWITSEVRLIDPDELARLARYENAGRVATEMKSVMRDNANNHDQLVANALDIAINGAQYGGDSTRGAYVDVVAITLGGAA